jgi:alpha-aminoadipate carrier protein LysW
MFCKKAAAPVSEVDAARHQRMKVVPRKPRKSTLFVLPKQKDKERFFVYLHPKCSDTPCGCQEMNAWKAKKEKTNMAQCPECDAVVELHGLMVGEITYCPDCNAELEVLNLEVPAVALAPAVEEDWGE